MKNKALKAIIIVLCIAVTVCGYFIYKLTESIDDTRANFNNRISQMQNEIQGIYANVDQMLEEQASIISSEEYTYGKLDIENHAVELICSVTPKEYSAENTKAEIYINGNAYPMAYSNGGFSAVVSIPLFKENKIEKIVFTEGDTVRTQETVQYFSPRHEYLPYISISFAGSYSNKTKNKTYIAEVNGNLDICIYGQTEGLEIASLDFVEVVDGVEVSRKPISSFESAHPLKESGFGWESVTAVPDMSSGNAEIDYSVSLVKNFEIPFGKYMIVYVEMKDNNGLVYLCNLFTRSISDNGNLLSNNSIEGSGSADIYTADGKLLYSES